MLAFKILVVAIDRKIQELPFFIVYCF